MRSKVTPFLLFMLLEITTGVLNYICESNTNFLLLCDDFGTSLDLFECQGYVARLASSLRSTSDGNRVAVGTFSKIITSLQKSATRTWHALEHDILDLEIVEAAKPKLKHALKITRDTISQADNMRRFVAVFIIGSNSGNETENEEIQVSAVKLYNEYPNFVGFVVTAGGNIDEASVSALHGGNEKHRWKIPSMDKLKDLEGIMHIRLACGSSGAGQLLQTTTPTTVAPPEVGRINVTIFSEAFYKGTQLTISLGLNECVNFKDYTLGSTSTNWDKLVRSVKTNNKCIHLSYDLHCPASSGYYPSLEYDSGIDEFELTNWRKDTRSIRQCPPKQGFTPKLNYISLYKERKFAGKEHKVNVSSIGSCYQLPKDVADPWLGSIRAHGNCVELYYGDPCKAKIVMRKVDADLPDVQQIIYPKSLKLCSQMDISYS